MAKKTINKELTGAQDLYNFLFEACNIIRGPVSQDNFKDYITPLLYYKRISDVYDEETEEALISSGGDKEYASLPEQHRFVIPDGCHCFLSNRCSGQIIEIRQVHRETTQIERPEVRETKD